MNNRKRITSILLTLIMLITMIPAMAFAEEVSDVSDAGTVREDVLSDEAAGSEDELMDESDMGYEELYDSQGIDPEDVEAAETGELLEEFMYLDEQKAKDADANSNKGNRLTGNNLYYYNNFKSIITNVGAAKQSSTIKVVKLSSMLGKRKFTAKQLGVSKIGYKSGGKWKVTSAAKEKIQKLLVPEDWKKVYKSLEGDMAANGFWVNWYSKDRFYEWGIEYNYTATTLTFKAGSYIRFMIPVVPEMGSGTYTANLSKIKAAISARNNARTVVTTFDNYAKESLTDQTPQYIDLYRLFYYCDVIAKVTEYDSYSANLPQSERYWRTPWDMINVFDGDERTKVVCAGYARAFKYLCDLSKFKSPWIECSIVTGSAGTGENSNHMWNLVRMNDGFNYVVDPTWMDTGDSADINKWFLRGAPAGTADHYTIEDNYREYDEWTRSVFLPAERILAKKNVYALVSNRAITIRPTKIKKLTKGKKSFTVKWNKMATPLAGLYIDGYQIQYSLKKNFSKAKTVTVYGYNKASKKISKLKKKKNYYVRIRTFAKMGGRTYYSAWSAKKKVKTK
ncbi:MAG: hypothetical protein IJH43_09535 [Mogibacterium sp.]|nr:hypothetical protein [Mogibacterium sp.]